MTALTDATVAPLALIHYDDTPRVRDVEIAERLGFDRPVTIRKLIATHADELARYGVVSSLEITTGPKGGRPGTEYHLNEGQALCIAALSRAPHADDVRFALITTYAAYRRGLIAPSGTDLTPGVVGGVVKAVTGAMEKRLEARLEEIINEALPRLVESALERDPRYTAVSFVPALDVLKRHNVPPKGRRGLSNKVSARLRHWCARLGMSPRMCAHSNHYLYPVEVVEQFVKGEGAALIRDHIAKVAGQGVLKLVPRQ